jgi:hypothetical protein
LQQAEERQRVDGTRERAPCGGEHVHGHADVERRLSPEAVGDRAIQALAQRESQEKHGEGDLDLPLGGAEILLEGRHRGQIHIDAQGRKSG